MIVGPCCRLFVRSTLSKWRSSISQFATPLTSSQSEEEVANKLKQGKTNQGGEDQKQKGNEEGTDHEKPEVSMDKYLRALAETENVRARLTKQIQDSKLFAIQGFCKDLTEIEEILRLAIDSVPEEQLTGNNNNNKHLKDLYEGLTMTSARLMQVFKTHGLTQINPIDGKFNPNEHEAIVVQDVAGKEAGTIIFVSKLGYKLHDRVIRPAVVGVAK